MLLLKRLQMKSCKEGTARTRDVLNSTTTQPQQWTIRGCTSIDKLLVHLHGTHHGSNSWMIDSNLMTAKRRDAKPRIQAKPRTIKTMSDLDPAGFSRDPFAAVVDILHFWECQKVKSSFYPSALRQVFLKRIGLSVRKKVFGCCRCQGDWSWINGLNSSVGNRTDFNFRLLLIRNFLRL